MQKVLSGSGRATFAFIGSNFVSLVKVSFVPWVALLVFLLMQWQLSIVQMRAITGESSLVQPVTSVIFSVLLSILGVFLFAWWFVRVVRLRVSGSAQMLGVTRRELVDSIMSALYLIGIYLMILIVMAPLWIPLAIYLISLPQTPQPITVPDSVFALVFIIFPLVWLLMLWLVSRFAVALPGVALGQRPHYFNDIWPLAKGESWGLPLRFIFWGFVLLIVMSLLFFPLMTMMMQGMTDDLGQNATPQAQLEVMANRMLPLQFALMLFQIFPLWFFTILLTEAFLRFRSKTVS